MVARPSRNPDWLGVPTALVILPTSTYRATDFVSAATGLGVDLVVASEEAPPIDMGDRFVQIDCTDPEASAQRIVSFADRVPIDGIVAADDAGTIIAAIASQRLGLRGNDPQAARATRDKAALRRILSRAEVSQPRWAPVEPGQNHHEAADDIGYPIVVKPTQLSASQGVIRADSPRELDEAVSRTRRIAGEGATILIEEFMGGVEIAIEGIVGPEGLDVLAIFDKPDTSSGPYFPETIFVTPTRLDAGGQVEALRVAESAITALGLSSGPVHIELKVEANKARVIEVAARSIGGLCSRSLNFGLMGTSLEALILRNALSLDKRELHREPVASGVLMVPIPRSGRFLGLSGEAETRSIPGITGLDSTVPQGEWVEALPEGDRYLAFVYARSDTPEAVESALRKAMDTLEVQLEA